MPSYSEWLKSTASTAPELRALAAEHQQARRLVVLRIEDLLASDHWGVYRQHLDALIAQETALLETIQAQILGDAVGDELAKLKGQAREAKGRRDGLAQARNLPDELLGEKKSLPDSPA